MLVWWLFTSHEIWFNENNIDKIFEVKRYYYKHALWSVKWQDGIWSSWYRGILFDVIGVKSYFFNLSHFRRVIKGFYEMIAHLFFNLSIDIQIIAIASDIGIMCQAGVMTCRTLVVVWSTKPFYQGQFLLKYSEMIPCSLHLEHKLWYVSYWTHDLFSTFAIAALHSSMLLIFHTVL